MTREELIETLSGDYHTIGAGKVPADSISLEALVNVLMEIRGDKPVVDESRPLKPGVTKKGHMYHLNGKLIKKADAYETY